MRPALTASLFAATLMVIAAPAHAADPKSIFGLWIEALPGGRGMVTEFTPTTITSYGVDETGKRVNAPISMAVTYRDLGKTIGVDFQGGGGALVSIDGPAAITLDFPDAAAHPLTPWKPKNGPTLKP